MNRLTYIAMATFSLAAICPAFGARDCTTGRLSGRGHNLYFLESPVESERRECLAARAKELEAERISESYVRLQEAANQRREARDRDLALERAMESAKAIGEINQGKRAGDAGVAMATIRTDMKIVLGAGVADRLNDEALLQTLRSLAENSPAK